MDIVAAEKARFWRGSVRLAMIMSMLGLAVMAGIVGMIFVLYGLCLSLAEIMKPWEAGLIVGGGMMFFAAILIMIIAAQGHVLRLEGNAIPIPKQSDNDSTAEFGSKIGDIIAQSNVKRSDIALTALIGGVVLGASPRLRQQILASLTDLIKSTGK
ncbi:hypothetical protein [Nitrosomonas oligotropha]|nr:hypothetical protein [Nitrosomonas oligotropha]